MIKPIKTLSNRVFYVNSNVCCRANNPRINAQCIYLPWVFLTFTQQTCNFFVYSIEHTLKGRSHEIFTVIFWLEWIYLDLNGNSYWFLNFKECAPMLDSYFKCSIPNLLGDSINLREGLTTAAKGGITSRRFYASPRRFGMKHTKT